MDRLKLNLSPRKNYSAFLTAVGRCGVGAAILIGIVPFAAAAKDYSSINIFGDSLVDSGNFFNLTRELTGTGLPPAPYAQQFSNGDVWAEQLAEALDLSPALSTAVLPGILSGSTPVPSEGINFALGGSLTDDSNSQPGLPGLQSQIAAFNTLSTFSPLGPNTLNVLLAGGNDYNQAIVSAPLAGLATLPDQVTNNLIDAIATLISIGAEDILVSNLPNLGTQPFAQTLNSFNPQSSASLSALSTQHNLLLSQKLTNLETASGANIIQLDLESFTDEAVNSPDTFGFTNVTDSCLSNFVSVVNFGTPCSNPDEYLFWDAVHPTTKAHSFVAQLAIDALAHEDTQKSVPEPTSTVVTLLVGGSLLLRRKQRIG